MRTYRRLISAIIAAAVSLSLCSCGGKEKNSGKKDDKIIESTVPSSSGTPEETTAPVSDGTTDAALQNETSTVPAAQTTTEVPTAPEETTAGETEPTTASEQISNAPTEPDGYKKVFDDLHKAYMSGSAEDIYSLYYPAEIEAFNRYMQSEINDINFDDKKLYEKDAVLDALGKSVDNIRGFMNSYGSESDEWVLNVSEASYTKIPEEQLTEFKNMLGLPISDGYILEMPFYYDKTNEQSFVAEPAASLCIGGKWYLCYSVAFSRLISYMDIEF